VFPNQKQVVQHAIPKLVAKTMEKFVMPALESCIITTTSFDLWMSIFGHDTFDLIIIFINSHWVPCHVIVGLFEAMDTSRIAMATTSEGTIIVLQFIGQINCICEGQRGQFVHPCKSF
jgi:hypothetical protein